MGGTLLPPWYELSDDNWDAFQSRQSDFFRSWVSHSTFQQSLEPSWLNQKHGPVTTFATHPSWLESERAAFKTYFETSNGTTSWGYGERFAPLGDEIIVTVVSSVTGRLIPPGAATLARSSRFLIKHVDDVIDVGVDGGRVIARVSNAPVNGLSVVVKNGSNSRAVGWFDEAAVLADMRTSQIGRAVVDAAESNKFRLEFSRSLFRQSRELAAPESRTILGAAFNKRAKVYLPANGSNAQASITAIHEGVHMLGVRGSQRAEVLARVSGLLHKGQQVSRGDLLRIYRDVRRIPAYQNMKINQGLTSPLFPGVKF